MIMSRRGWVLYTLAWVPPTAVYSQLLAGKQGLGGVAAFAWTALQVFPIALVGVLLWRLSERFPVDGRRPCRFALLQAAGAAVFALVWLAAATAVFAARTAAHSGGLPLDDIARRLPAIVRVMATWHIMEGVILYCVIAGISYAIRGERARRAQIEAIAAADAYRARAELAALRGQLNPHFFFNTLHSVTALIQHRPGDAVVALQRLGDLFRYVLNASQEGGDEARLGDEWAFTKNYLALESLRLGDRLRIVESIDPATYNCVVPSFTLQPLVENAIAHAVAPRSECTTIQIRSWRENGRLIIEVADDGPGASGAAATTGHGVGLRAVRQRVQAASPGIGAVDIETHPGAGFRVAVTVAADDGAIPAEAATI